jgi:hypothetical protein
MVSRVVLLALLLGLAMGCVHPKVAVPMVTHAVAPAQLFIAQNFDWSSVQRVVLMPLANQTAYPNVRSEIQTNLAAELQRAGRFDIVVATREDPEARAQDVFTTGQFNELELLRIAREYQAQAVLFVNVTQYHPYAPPRLGLSLLLVSPAEGIAIASTDGFWDARETATSAQMQAYFNQTQNWPRSLLSSDRVRESPDVFQRFVCEQVATSWYPPSGGGLETIVPVRAAMSQPDPLLPCPPASDFTP